MNKPISYQIQNSILIRTFYGEVYLQDLIDSVEYMVEHSIVTEELTSMISDFTQASFLLTKEETQHLRTLILKYPLSIGHLNFIQIIPTPNIAKTMIFKEQNPDINTRSFSTIKGAMDWLAHV
tara:strand:- start:20035 stop:20403 length:369 start_codon:yes stop_codon:yes gene_type:complete